MVTPFSRDWWKCYPLVIGKEGQTDLYDDHKGEGQIEIPSTYSEIAERVPRVTWAEVIESWENGDPWEFPDGLQERGNWGVQFNMVEKGMESKTQFVQRFFLAKQLPEFAAAKNRSMEERRALHRQYTSDRVNLEGPSQDQEDATIKQASKFEDVSTCYAYSVKGLQPVRKVVFDDEADFGESFLLGIDTAFQTPAKKGRKPSFMVIPKYALAYGGEGYDFRNLRRFTETVPTKVRSRFWLELSKHVRFYLEHFGRLHLNFNPATEGLGEKPLQFLHARLEFKPKYYEQFGSTEEEFAAMRAAKVPGWSGEDIGKGIGNPLENNGDLQAYERDDALAKTSRVTAGHASLLHCPEWQYYFADSEDV